MEIIENELIVSFLDDTDNRELFENYQMKNSDDIKMELDQRFRVFYQRYRLISYFIKVLHFESMHFDKKLHLHNKRYQLATAKSGGAELICEQHFNQFYEYHSSSLSFQDHLTSEELFRSFNQLTEKQKYIITLSYLHQMTDTEISKSLGISQQSVYKTRKSAIKKLRDGVNSECLKEKLLYN
ncbi:RNA polymerase sigma factor, sigma-70 family [Psychrobacillus sp. OK028]|uniref:sigma-70 family RNA polymerase sigma factor n=1 Tax=Psychrobacillus sp. OK028 TaxID=1884359 RepID=UPI000887C097|nr:sigma-70 family RNA polymerase sigma factor [Psychrobacillus sp. OK028]SDM59151.1 RNA polymerase sigma factor, sigma-70 family [Psychrobacillus sp. OK028]